MMIILNKKLLSVLFLSLTLSACSWLSPPKKTVKKAKTAKPRPSLSLAKIQASGDSREIVMYALGLLDVGYRFGGNNPEAGLDCSGMVAFIYKNALGIQLPRNAAQIAARTKSIKKSELKAGDMVFFNTMNRPHSHMGIYLGDGKFVHAPRTNSTIRVESMDSPYFSSRFDGARTVF